MGAAPNRVSALRHTMIVCLGKVGTGRCTTTTSMMNDATKDPGVRTGTDTVTELVKYLFYTDEHPHDICRAWWNIKIMLKQRKP